jgi:hypothetical protein
LLCADFGRAVAAATFAKTSSTTEDPLLLVTESRNLAAGNELIKLAWCAVRSRTNADGGATTVAVVGLLFPVATGPGIIAGEDVTEFTIFNAAASAGAFNDVLSFTSFFTPAIVVSRSPLALETFFGNFCKTTQIIKIRLFSETYRAHFYFY